MKKILIVILFFITTINIAFSITAVSSDFQSWNSLTVSGSFDKADPRLSNFKYLFNYQERMADDASTSFQTVLRGGLGYSLNTNHSIWLGADYIITRNLVPEEVNISGIWQQYQYDNKYNELKYQYRVRLEELIISNRNHTVLRGRYRVKASHPITESKN